MKGIILAGGTGKRLYPITFGVSKHVLPIYDKPMIYYPLSVLMLAGIREILIITTAEDLNAFQRLLGDGSAFGIILTYEIQLSPDGIAQAFLIAESFVGNSRVCLVLGDNIFFGQNFSPKLKQAVMRPGATIFGYQVLDPERFGVVEFGVNQKAISIEEKPSRPKSNYAVTGLYFYDSDVVSIAKLIQPSKRGELEISCINREYMAKGELHVEVLGRGFAWLDTGTCDSLLEASSFIQTIEHRQGFKVAVIEEIALMNGWIDEETVLRRAQLMKCNSYGKYLMNMVFQRQI
ncbi:glucose-1-phosphate thymidylyltransferase RfbA [Rheinheimera sp.]|uniref:glucose-1-phosphate thymidylyltransferase RfbA n=1 Tax=Rheinheimera sp. TaxID=1869214 RepID=UPI00307EB88D